MTIVSSSESGGIMCVAGSGDVCIVLAVGICNPSDLCDEMPREERRRIVGVADCLNMTCASVPPLVILNRFRLLFTRSTFISLRKSGSVSDQR